MKKLFVTCLAVAMIFGFSNAFAGSDGYDYGQGWAADPDTSHSVSLWGWGNDKANADANGGGGFWVEAQTNGSDYHYAEIDGIAVGSADTHTYAFDFGKTSKAGAKSTISGWAFAEGETLAGKTDWRGRGVDSLIQGATYFAGVVSQSNEANETGYAGGDGVSAGNWSAVQFENGKSFSDSNDFYGYNYESGYTEGFVSTEGNSIVTIDPDGNFQSLNAKTCTTSYFDTNHKGDSNSAFMQGAGGVSGGVSNQYGAFVGGNAQFSYAGTTDRASGGADMNATIQKTSHSTTVQISASSNATLLNTAKCSGGGCGDQR
jgi:hypothetical protein